MVALFGSLAWWLRVAVKAAWLGGVMASRTHEERERERPEWCFFFLCLSGTSLRVPHVC